jgi:hypothetical protein
LDVFGAEYRVLRRDGARRFVDAFGKGMIRGCRPS